MFYPSHWLNIGHHIRQALGDAYKHSFASVIPADVALVKPLIDDHRPSQFIIVLGRAPKSNAAIP
tara:strand:+ start:573 stop:767 length:195 start_codon:yes stop_codon:yes gene_type:complete